MLRVTGERPKSRDIYTVTNTMSIATKGIMDDPSSALNQRHLSGKKEGSLVLGQDDGNEVIFVSSGELPESAWHPMFAGGGGGGGGITKLATSESERAITFIDENGRKGKLMYCDIKATPMEFYLDILNQTAGTGTTLGVSNVQVGTEYVLPIGDVSMSGRHHHITVDRATNRVHLPAGGLRGQVRVYGAFRWSTSVKDDMDIDTIWYCRRKGSSDAWQQIYSANSYRTASQTTAAMSFGTNSGYFNLPDSELELEVRIKFNKIGSTGIEWGKLPIFNTNSDGVKISLLKNPNFEYVT
ncbi:MAG: hypothetical protein ACRDB3_17885 [Citrobacter telavivensis]